MSSSINQNHSLRSSNIELLRIIAMLLIIAHHYVVNSTVVTLFDGCHPTVNSVFLQLWGMWGKTAINVFVLITGYFMCTGKLTLRRYLKVLLEIVFYSWVMYGVLCVAGYEEFAWGPIVKRIVSYSLITGVNGGFVSAFLWMYLMIPFFNKFIQSMSKKEFCLLVLILLIMFCGVSTITRANVYHYVFWYMALYFVGALIRLHPLKWMGNNKFCLLWLCFSVLLAWGSVISIDVLAYIMGKSKGVYFSYYFVSDSHKILAFSTSLFAFLVFKNWEIGYRKWINVIASTTFGVLLIHGATNGMRRWLWQDFVNVPGAYTWTFLNLVGYSIIVMIGVFVTCSILDWIRIRFVEKYYLDLGERICLKIWSKVKVWVEKYFSCVH